MALDPLSIATDGYLSKYKWTLSVATRGYLSQYAIVVIPIPPQQPSGALGFGVLYTDDKEHNREAQLHQEDSEILLIMQIFMMKWN
jgi:hypothetical protein